VPLQVKEWLIAQLRGRPGGAVLSVGALNAIWATAALILLMGLLSAVYKVAAGDHPPLRRLLPGAALAAALWALVLVAFPFALSTVLHFGVTYGSFSAAIVLLVYPYLLAAAVLVDPTGWHRGFRWRSRESG
jgi:membrane protein